MVKPLTFKGDKKVKKRKHRDREGGGGDGDEGRRRKALQTSAADAETVADDDTWVSAEVLGDVAGPVMIVLPSVAAGPGAGAGAGTAATSTAPTALACDANGKVFAMPVENIVDGNPSSAEPHDVRQVWVASRIVGTEHFRFKGHHGRYLGCDKYGLLSATAVAVSPLESFLLVDATKGGGGDGGGGDGSAPPETFQIKTLRDTYLSVQRPAAASGSSSSSSSAAAAAAPDVRGDATEPNLHTTVRIRMQARFKPRIQASKEDKAREKISRRQLEEAAGRRLADDEVKLLKRARREGDYHEKLLDLKVKTKHDRFG